MSSSIDSLRAGGDMNDGDTQLVDSILNDLKQNKPEPEQQYQEQQQQELTPEQQKMADSMNKDVSTRSFFDNLKGKTLDITL